MFSIWEKLPLCAGDIWTSSIKQAQSLLNAGAQSLESKVGTIKASGRPHYSLQQQNIIALWAYKAVLSQMLLFAAQAVTDNGRETGRSNTFCRLLGNRPSRSTTGQKLRLTGRTRRVQKYPGSLFSWLKQHIYVIQYFMQSTWKPWVREVLYKYKRKLLYSVRRVVLFQTLNIRWYIWTGSQIIIFEITPWLLQHISWCWQCPKDTIYKFYILIQILI